MIKLKQGMDPHSLEIVRPGEDPEHVGYIQWHPERPARIVLTESFSFLTLNELDTILLLYRQHHLPSQQVADLPSWFRG